MRGDASKRVRNNLVLETIAEKENIELSEEELDAELEKMTQNTERSVEELRGIFAANGNLDVLKKNDFKVKKTVDFLVENAK